MNLIQRLSSLINSIGLDIKQLNDNKQDNLVSGTNIKSINNQSLLGSGNINISGSGINLIELEIDFGTINNQIRLVNVTDSNVNIGNKILIYKNPKTATDRVGNDWELDQADFTAIAGNGEFNIYINTKDIILGKRYIYYQII
jgi:hypothetical protein